VAVGAGEARGAGRGDRSGGAPEGTRLSGAPPVLWHITFSNFNEKARWALDYKGVRYRLRAAPPGLHPLWARRLGGGRTFPLLQLDGETIGDSTRIVAELERRHPEPALYPADPADRARALELEDFFDEQAGPEVRRVGLDHATRDADFAVAAMFPGAGGATRTAFKLAARPGGVVVRRYYGVDDQAVARGWELVGAAIDRFQRELQPSGYLVGDRFSIADLTFAALVGSAVQPPGFPYPAREPEHRGLPQLRSLLAERGVLEWIEDMYARHRGTRLLPG
jgi:glutathione S-transferase